MLRSLRARIILSSAIPSLLFILVGIFVVLQLARNVQRDEFIATLEVELLQLVAWAQVTEDGSFDPKLPGATRFETAFSGWYYQVFEVQDQDLLVPVASSSSLQQGRLNISEIDDERDRWFTETVGPTGERLMIVVQRVSATTLADNAEIPNPDAVFLITVARDMAPLARSTATLYRALTIGSAIAVLLIIVGTAFLLTFGLLPLRHVERSLFAIRSGKAKRLEGEFPSEIAPLASEINLLINENEKVVERARTQVGNLAHALKTPLSVLTNEAGGGGSTLADAVREQSALMRAHVDRYLARARVAATSQVLGVRTDITPVMDRLVRAMNKVNAEKEINFETDIPVGLFLRGEQQDLEEVIGNLLENAFKWAERQIRLTVARSGGELVFTVEDDGPGLPPEDRALALKRGQRFDETTPGTGLGLSIVADIVSAYGGEVDLGESQLGGLKARVTLPSVR